MVARGHGAIVNVASLTGVEFGGGGRVPYGASKGGVMGLTRALAVEWALHGVRVNAVAPGIVATPMVTGLAADGSLDLDDLAARVPLGRIATPEDIAGVTLMLVSPAGAYIVGQTIVVDGGLSSAGPRDTSADR
jgi:NAD(P)-dependent dehydrogenase (short-subunit alcohol dehydrogenase family)